MPFQLQGVRVLLEREAVLLADEMGLGKTVQALAAIRLAALRGLIESCLVVVPASVFAQWRHQFRIWSPELRLVAVRGSPVERALQWRTPAHAYLVGYEALRADLHLARGRVWDLVVLDDAQRIKNAGTEVALAVKRLLRRRGLGADRDPAEEPARRPALDHGVPPPPAGRLRTRSRTARRGPSRLARPAAAPAPQAGGAVPAAAPAPQDVRLPPPRRSGRPTTARSGRAWSGCGRGARPSGWRTSSS